MLGKNIDHLTLIGLNALDDENVIAGQGTIGLEILNPVTDADVVVATSARTSFIINDLPVSKGKKFYLIQKVMIQLFS